MRVYHFTSLQYGIKAIEQRHVKVARINALNDPFEYLQFQSDNHAVKLIQKSRKSETDKRFGILCFTKNYTNPVLWAHYADNHKGICLGFDVPAELLLQVEYVATRHPASSFNAALALSDEDFLKFMLTKKHEHWAYEQELRLLHRFDRIAKQDLLCFADFNENLRLAEVILGFKSHSSRAAVARTLKANGIKAPVLTVAPSSTHFEMVTPL